MTMTTFNILTEDQFAERFPLVPNHLDPHAAWDGFMFETFGRELEFVCAQPADRIWTVLDCDGALVVSSGKLHVNRLGYLVSTVAVPDDHEYEVICEDLTAPEEEEVA